MLASRRYVECVRASQAYIAGFGTAGSLLAGATMLFALASAFVAFTGWPQVGDQPSSAPVIITDSDSPAASAGANRVAAVVAAQAVARSGVLSAPGHANASGAAVSRSKPTSSGRRLPAPPTGPVTITPAPGTPSCAGIGCVVGPSAGGSGTVVQGVTGTLSNTVATTGAKLGSAVTGVAGSLAGGLTGVSSSLAGVVNNVGQTLGSTVTGATGAAAGTL